MKINYAKYWDGVAMRWATMSYTNELLAEHKRKTYLSLVAKWAKITSSQRILKTDLFEEAFDSEQFSFDLAEFNNNILGIDISREMVRRAKGNARQYGVTGEYLCGDVRQLPFRNNSINLVISNSTLDHFPDESSIIAALQELQRVLCVGGTLILTIDNKDNLTYPPYVFTRIWMRLGLAPYFIGKTMSPKELRHALEESGFSVEEITAIFHYPHPDALVRGSERFLRWLGKGKFDNAIREILNFLDKLETKRTKYLTGRYIAVKAVKVATP